MTKNEDMSTDRFAERLIQFLERVDFKLAVSREERRAVFKLRHHAYMREGAISPTADGLLTDPLDELGNCWIVTVHVDGELAGSVRIHAASRGFPNCPSSSVFPEIILPMIEDGKTFVDPTRFVANPDFAASLPELPYLTLRAACMASEYFGADFCLASVREEHRAFYRRVFAARSLASARPYPGLAKPICLLSADINHIRHRLYERFPFFDSTVYEQSALFSWQPNSLNQVEDQPTSSIRPEVEIDRF